MKLEPAAAFAVGLASLHSSEFASAAPSMRAPAPSNGSHRKSEPASTRIAQEALNNVAKHALAELTTCTVLFLTNADCAHGSFPEHTMVDGVLCLTDELSELRPSRHIRVLKMRGTAPIRGLHTVRITDRGLEVQPRIETVLPSRPVDEALEPGEMKSWLLHSVTFGQLSDTRFTRVYAAVPRNGRRS